MEGTMMLSAAGTVSNDDLFLSDPSDSTHFTSTPSLVHNFSPTAICAQIIVKDVTESPKEDVEDSASSEVQTHALKFHLTVLMIMCVISVPANIINMAVFCKQGLKDRVNLCLFVLALTDALYLISATILNSENIYSYLTTQTLKAHWNADMVNHNLLCFFGFAFLSFVMSGIVACERCYCVINPLKFHTLMRTRTMAVIIISLSTLLFGLHFIVVYKYRVGCVYDPFTGTVTTALIEGEFYKAHRELVDCLETIVFGVGVVGGMMIVVMIATVITTVKLRQLMTWRTETSSSLSSRDVALTKMLLANSVFFIICLIPSCVFRLLWFFLPEMGAGGRHHNLFISGHWILGGFVYINHTFNFFIYYVMGSKFRETLWAMLGRNLNQKKSNS